MRLKTPNLNTGQIPPANPQTEPSAASNYRVAVSFIDPDQSYQPPRRNVRSGMIKRTKQKTLVSSREATNAGSR